MRRKRTPAGRRTGAPRPAVAPRVSAVDPYMDMVREYRRNEKRLKVEASESGTTSPLGRSRVAEAHAMDPVPAAENPAPSSTLASDSDSDLAFEDVDIDNSASDSSETYDEPLGDVSVSLDSGQARHLTRAKRQSLRKPQRLLLHKLGLAAWLVHAQLRNKWLARPDLLQDAVLTGLLPLSVHREIHPPAHLTPFLKSKKLVDGLEHAMEAWRAAFRVVRPGLASHGQEFGDVVDSYLEFKAILLSLSGSSDMLGQGYVALIRSLGLEVRLVCSLQPPDNLQAEPGAPGPGSRLESACPLYWAEVWDPYATKWIVVDPLTGTVRLPTRSKTKLKIEPPLSDHLNVLRYCFAFDGRGYARDVTRRYAYAYNARTRKKRLPYVESERWLDRIAGIYAKTAFTRFDRDELVELARYPRLEGIPTRVQDFVGHPEYALADQLHRNEVLRPGAQPCGVLAPRPGKSGRPAAGKPPSYIYQRRDVVPAKSSRSWYRQGREIALGAQPRAHRPMKNRLTGEEEATALYTYDQTVAFQPPSVDADGTVPKSEYRTVDIFTPQMVPIGATHIPVKGAATAAKLLQIDYANAVVGVEYGKRGAQSSVLGIVVADQFVDAVHAVLQGFEEQERANANRLNTARILRLWRQFIMGIQIWERVESMNPSTSDALVEGPEPPAGGSAEGSSEVTSEMTSKVPSEAASAVTSEAPSEAPSEIPSKFPSAQPLEQGPAPTESRPRRNFRALLKLNVPILPAAPKYFVSAADVARIQARLHSPEASTGPKSSARQDPSPRQKPPVSAAPVPVPVPTGPYSSDSFDDLDVDEISESEL